MSLEHILARQTGRSRDKLIPILQEVQEESGFLSRDAIQGVASFLGLPPSKVYGVATFYNQFRFQPRGRFPIAVCRGTACHVKGSAAVLAALQRELKVEPGGTTRDGIFSLEVVSCIGACGLAPVIAVGSEFHAGIQTTQISRILSDYRKRVTREDAFPGEESA